MSCFCQLLDVKDPTFHPLGPGVMKALLPYNLGMVEGRSARIFVNVLAIVQQMNLFGYSLTEDFNTGYSSITYFFFYQNVPTGIILLMSFILVLEAKMLQLFITRLL